MKANKKKQHFHYSSLSPADRAEWDESQRILEENRERLGKKSGPTLQHLLDEALARKSK